MKPRATHWLLASLSALSLSALAEPAPSRPVATVPVKSLAPAQAAPQTAEHANHAGPLVDGLQPPGIMLGHSGKFMLSYDYMFESMRGNLDGTRKVSESEVLSNFFAAPTDMTMQMHMFMGMYAVNNDLSLMVNAPYLVKKMSHVTQDGERFDEKTSGFGDVELRAQYRLYTQANKRHQVLLNGGINLPTGSINERLNGFRLEYPMQLGAGTFSLVPGLTYLGRSDTGWGWGAEFVPTIRVGTNDNDYRLGNQYRLNAWVIRQVADTVHLSLRADGKRTENIKGADPELDTMDEQTKDPNLQAGTRLDLLGGVSFAPRILEGQKITLEAGAPVYQSLDGPQLKTTFVGRLNWQIHF